MRTIFLPRLLSTLPSPSGLAPALRMRLPESLLFPARPRWIGGRGPLCCTSVLALPLLLLLLLPAAAQAQFNYTTNAGTITITGYTGADGVATIPSTINGLPVTSIGSAAFRYRTSLTSVTIGNSVTNIGFSAFYLCTSLTSVYFEGNAPTAVGSAVFFNANNATVYYLPGTTGWGLTFAGRPTALWNPTVPTGHPSFGVQANQFGFTITGSSNLVIVVEAASDLGNPAWTPVSTNTLNTFVGTNGTSYFTDPQWTNHTARFYRLRSP